jgi:hypothetical protein
MNDPSGFGVKDEALSWTEYRCATSLVKVQYQFYYPIHELSEVWGGKQPHDSMVG